MEASHWRESWKAVRIWMAEQEMLDLVVEEESKLEQKQ